MRSIGPVDDRTWPHGPIQLISTLAWLRLCAIAGQALTIAFVAGVLRIQLPLAKLAAAIGFLGIFACFAFWRLSRPWRVSSMESVAHIAVDTFVLWYLLHLTGGATNPFVSLLVMPITLAATALPLRQVAIVAALSVAAYLVLMYRFVPLPAMHDVGVPGGFNLHITGMAISFAITAAMLGFFIARLARALRARQADAELERERALRDEGILAIATQAASTAHELNTPLSTMRTLLGELARDHATDSALSADIALLSGQAERCRNILRDLVAVGSNQLAGIPEPMPVGDFVCRVRESFHLLRPEIEVSYTGDAAVEVLPIHVMPALSHALVNLLNNAADASIANGIERVELDIGRMDDRLALRVRDFGPGMQTTIQRGAGLRFQTTKHDGLGLGLALANATAERFGGSLIAQATASGGTLQCLLLPLATLDNPDHGH